MKINFPKLNQRHALPDHERNMTDTDHKRALCSPRVPEDECAQFLHIRKPSAQPQTVVGTILQRCSGSLKPSK